MKSREIKPNLEDRKRALTQRLWALPFGEDNPNFSPEFNWKPRPIDKRWLKVDADVAWAGRHKKLDELEKQVVHYERLVIRWLGMKMRANGIQHITQVELTEK